MQGRADLIAEVISPGSLKLDITLKKRLYERVGVKEYWIVYPHERNVMAYILDEQGKFTDGEAYAYGDTIPVRLWADCLIDLSEVFADSGS